MCIAQTYLSIETYERQPSIKTFKGHAISNKDKLYKMWVLNLCIGATVKAFSTFEGMRK